MPRADDLPSFKVGYTNTPCTHNDLGVKGCGEAGAIASPPALINAVIDALSPLGVTDMSMPATPQKVWKAIQESQSVAAEYGEINVFYKVYKTKQYLRSSRSN